MVSEGKRNFHFRSSGTFQVLCIRKPEEAIDLFMFELMHMRHKFDVDTHLRPWFERPVTSDAKSVVELITGKSDDGQEKANEEAPENNPLYRTIYVGNLAPEVTSANLHCHFHALGAGLIEDICIQRDKGFGFIRYNSHAEAARAIQLGNTRILFDKPVKVLCHTMI